MDGDDDDDVFVELDGSTEELRFYNLQLTLREHESRALCHHHYYYFYTWRDGQAELTGGGVAG